MSQSPRRKSSQTLLPRSERVVVSWLFPQDVSGQFTGSLVNMLGYDLHVAGGRVLNGGGFIPISSGPNLSTARNKQVTAFLEMDADWLLIVDSDMAFEPDALERLMVEADPVRAPVVGGLCFGKKQLPDGTLEYFPTMYGFDSELRSFRYNEWPDNTMFPVNGTGTAFLLIHRSVLEAMRDKFQDRAPWVWFEEVNFSGQIFSEDVTFCVRAQQCGFPIHVHTGVEILHMKPEAISAATYRGWYEAGGRDYLAGLHEANMAKRNADV